MTVAPIFRRATQWCLSGTLLTLTACSSARISMQVPAQLAATPALEVQGREGWQLRPTYRFGEFKAANIRPGWLTTSSWHTRPGIWAPPSAWFDQSRTKRRFSFQLVGPAGPTWQVQGAYYAWSQELKLAPNTPLDITLNREEVYSSIIQAPDQPAWQLILDSRHQLGDAPQPLQGSLTNGDQLVLVRPIGQLMRRDGKPMNLPLNTPVGYEFVLPDGGVVAAVELMGLGRVWLKPGLEPELRAPLAAAATSLLVQQ